MKSTFTYGSLNNQVSNQAYWPLRGGSSSNSPKASHRLGLRWLNNLFSVLVSQLVSSSDPLVWRTEDASGEAVWNAKDTASGKVIRGASEAELRVWLEERYRF